MKTNRFDVLSQEEVDQIQQSKPIPIVLIRGGGDLASGVVTRLHHVGINVVITELEKPLAVRRLVSFSEAVYDEMVTVENITARRAAQSKECIRIIKDGEIPVMVDPKCSIRYYSEFNVISIVDARMRKTKPEQGLDTASFVIGLGPGFIVGENCDAVIETNRGHYLGRVIWKGSAEPDTGIPGTIGQKEIERVIRSPTDGKIMTKSEIGVVVEKDTTLAIVDGLPISAPFTGLLRGLLRSEVLVFKGMKVGDLDPRDDPKLAHCVSEKSLAIAGGVLEALISQPKIRSQLWS